MVSNRIKDYIHITQISGKISIIITFHISTLHYNTFWIQGCIKTSKEFQLLMQTMSVNHLASSPHDPHSNGLAEKFVGIVKTLFHKAKEEGQSPYTALMVYRNTPLNGILQSPMQILQGRQARTDLPLSHAAKVEMGIKHAP